MTVAREYSDNDISAYNGKRRPGYQQLLEDITSGEIQAVIISSNDRLTRHPMELEQYIILSDAREVSTHSVVGGDFDLATPGGRLHARQLGSIARYESENRSARIAAKVRQKALAGEYHGGVKRPFGFQSDGITHDNPEAAEIRRMTSAALAGESLGSIIRDLNRRNIRSVRGNTWSYVTVRAMLLRPRNAGIRQYRGDEIGEAVWEPIISPAEFDAVKRLLNDPDRRTTRNSGRRHLLSGIARCGVCQKGMKSGGSRTRAGTPFKVYRCCTTRNMSKLDALVIAVVKEVLSNHKWSMSEISPRPEPSSGLSQSEVEEAEMFAAEQFARGALTTEQFRRMNSLLIERRAELAVEEEQSEFHSNERFTGVPFGVDLDSLSTARMRRLIQEVVDIEVMPVGKSSNKRGTTILDHVEIVVFGSNSHVRMRRNQQGILLNRAKDGSRLQGLATSTLDAKGLRFVETFLGVTVLPANEERFAHVWNVLSATTLNPQQARNVLRILRQVPMEGEPVSHAPGLNTAGGKTGAERIRIRKPSSQG